MEVGIKNKAQLKEVGHFFK